MARLQLVALLMFTTVIGLASAVASSCNIKFSEGHKTILQFPNAPLQVIPSSVENCDDILGVVYCITSPTYPRTCAMGTGPTRKLKAFFPIVGLGANVSFSIVTGTTVAPIMSPFEHASYVYPTSTLKKPESFQCATPATVLFTTFFWAAQWGEVRVVPHAPGFEAYLCAAAGPAPTIHIAALPISGRIIATPNNDSNAKHRDFVVERFSVEVVAAQATSPRFFRCEPRHETWVRRNVENLPDDELDRYMIAMLRFQEEGRVEYRTLASFHGGGHANSNRSQQEILRAKAIASFAVKKQLGGAEWMGEGEYFPDEFTNSRASDLRTLPNATSTSHMAYPFSWHHKSWSNLWHRAFTLEFELMLQSYDPATPAQVAKYGKLHLPYWKSDDFNGTVPKMFRVAEYVVRSGEWSRFPSGTRLRNPLYRWYTPRSIYEHAIEYFPELNDATSTTRDAQAYVDDGFVAQVVNGRMGGGGSLFAPGATFSEVFHSSLLVKYPWFVDLTFPWSYDVWHMSATQLGGASGCYSFRTCATYDPIFWVSHSQSERFYVSYQTLHDGDSWDYWEPQDVLETPMYPAPRIDKLLKGHRSVDSPITPEFASKFADWTDYYRMPYRYDTFVEARASPKFREYIDAHPTYNRIVASSNDQEPENHGQSSAALIVGSSIAALIAAVSVAILRLRSKKQRFSAYEVLS